MLIFLYQYYFFINLSIYFDAASRHPALHWGALHIRNNCDDDYDYDFDDDGFDSNYDDDEYDYGEENLEDNDDNEAYDHSDDYDFYHDDSDDCE